MMLCQATPSPLKPKSPNLAGPIETSNAQMFLASKATTVAERFNLGPSSLGFGFVHCDCCKSLKFLQDLWKLKGSHAEVHKVA